MQNNKPILGITMGDPASIGPEILVKAFNLKEVHDICNPIAVGDSRVIQKSLDDLGVNKKINRVNNVDDAIFEFNTLNIYDLKLIDADTLEVGKIYAEAGDAAFRSVKTVIELAQSGVIDATVTGPINKESINLAGHKYSGHTEIYAHYTNTKKYGMLLVDDNLRVIHVSTHVSLREACDLVKKERILDTIELIVDACNNLGIENPKIGVAGINPHASDGGLFGKEEEEEILPAVIEANKRGYIVEGPVPADTLFTKAVGGLYDGCIAMYHDQGHIPFKLVGFNWDTKAGKMKSVKGVNITLGLPIIRTSVDHGTAMEIAGKGIASPDALVMAINYAAKLSLTKREVK